MTTVGYGDIAPQTVLGQTLAAGVMILGCPIIIVPVGTCPSCGQYGHEIDSIHRRHCGAKLRGRPGAIRRRENPV